MLKPVHASLGILCGRSSAVTDTAHSAAITWDAGIHHLPAWTGERHGASHGRKSPLLPRLSLTRTVSQWGGGAEADRRHKPT